MKPFLADKTFELPYNEVHLWHCHFDAHKDSLEVLKRILSEDELKKASKFKFYAHQKQFIISRGVLRILIGKYLDHNPCRLVFGYTTYGKPYVSRNRTLQFNISHSGNRAVFAFVQNSKIGVDIEILNKNIQVMDVAENSFSPDEIQALQIMPRPQQLAAFYRCWTRKESFIKAKGSGLSFSLSSFTVSLVDDTAELLCTDWNHAEKDQWQLFTFSPEAGYQGALSVCGTFNKVRQMNCEQLDFE